MEVRENYARFRERNMRVLAVVYSQPEMLAIFVEDNPMPFAVVVDPSREAYRVFGLERTSWWRILRPSIIWRYLRMMWKGVGVRRPNKGEDVLQLGGDFVLDTTGKIVFAYRSADPTDRPSVETILEVITKDRGIVR